MRDKDAILRMFMRGGGMHGMPNAGLQGIAMFRPPVNTKPKQSGEDTQGKTNGDQKKK